MSVCVGEEFILIPEEGSDKEKPEMKVDNPNSKTNAYQEDWCVGKNFEGQLQLKDMSYHQISRS